MFKTLCLGIALTLNGVAFAEFKNQSEAGVVLTGGNAKTQSWNIQSTSHYKLDKNAFRLKGSYLAAKQRDVESAEKWNLELRYERELDADLNGFLAQSVDGDKFAGILQRYNTDLGAKYFLIKKENDLNWLVEAGYRFTHEHNTSGVIQDFQKARVYTEVEKYWAATTSTKFSAEYIPNFTFADGWLLNSEASVTSALSTTLSVKTSYLINYNNSPSVLTAGRTDTTFTTSLVAKF